MKKYQITKLGIRFLCIVTLLIVLAGSFFLFQLIRNKTSRQEMIGTAQDKAIANCANLTQGKLICWNNLIKKSLTVQGLSQTFSLVENLYKTQPTFAADCHQYMHELGGAAFEGFVSHKDIALTDASSYCGYGFYHGFMEKMLLNSDDYKEASEFCRKVTTTMSPVLSDACYHGVGHGAVSVSVFDRSNWGNAKSIVNSSLIVCDKIADSAVNNLRCASGVFMEVSGYLASSQYNLTVNDKNPLQICQEQTLADIETVCYTQMYPVLGAISKGDITHAMKYVAAVPNNGPASELAETLVGSMVNLQNDQSKTIQICRGIQERLQLKCIDGIALGYMLKGQPGEEYKQAIGFCSQSGLTSSEQNSCYGLVLSQSRNTYSPEDLKNVCQEVGKYSSINCSTP